MGLGGDKKPNIALVKSHTNTPFPCWAMIKCRLQFLFFDIVRQTFIYGCVQVHKAISVFCVSLQMKRTFLGTFVNSKLLIFDGVI